MISLSAETSDTTHLEALKEREIPLVFFDRIVDHIDTPKVITDDYNSGIQATEHLIKNGCKRIAFLSISKTLSITNKRMDGYLDALNKNKIKKEASLTIISDGDEAKDMDQIKKLLKRKDRPDGIFASV